MEWGTYPAVVGICIRRRLHGRLVEDARGRRDLLALADLGREREDGGAAGEGTLLAARLAEGREALAIENLCVENVASTTRV